MTAAERRAWARYSESMKWALAAGGRGDAHRARLGLERAWAQLGADLVAANLPPPRPRYKPELKLLCGTHPVFVPPAPPPANDVRCVTCEDTGRLTDGRPCQFCARPTERPALANDVEEPTAIEGATLAELPVVDRSPDVVARADHYMESRHEARLERAQELERGWGGR